jgi:hypothetical protein
LHDDGLSITGPKVAGRWMTADHQYQLVKLQLVHSYLKDLDLRQFNRGLNSMHPAFNGQIIRQKMMLVFTEHSRLH